MSPKHRASRQTAWLFLPQLPGEDEETLESYSTLTGRQTGKEAIIKLDGMLPAS